jgi:redox-sensitive bicupin YhaK (pirin superfamily)
MDRSLMNNLQAPPGAARLDAHTARRLPAAAHRRWLAVLQGEVWLTTDGHGDEPGEDVWIAAGERWLLPAGASVVLQGEPRAEVQLVEAEPKLVSAASPGRAASAWQALRAWARRQGLIAPAPCAAC